MSARTDVALILWNADVIDLMSFVLLRRNIRSRGIEPSPCAESILEYIGSCSPAVVIYDLEPPYDRSAANALFLLNRLPDCSFVMTCADRGLALRTAPWLTSHPVFQKPYPVDDVADTVGSMLRRGSRKLVPVS